MCVFVCVCVCVCVRQTERDIRKSYEIKKDSIHTTNVEVMSFVREVGLIYSRIIDISDA